MGGSTMGRIGLDTEHSGDDHFSLEGALESMRTYLLCVAWRLKGGEGVAGAEGASDLVQQTMLVALRKAREGDGPGLTPRDRRAWLRQILVNLMREKARRAARDGGGLGESEVDSGTSPSADLARREQARAIAGVLDRLEPGDREVVLWRCVDGLTYEEIGRRKGYSASYARRVVGSSLGRLRSMLGGSSDGRTG